MNEIVIKNESDLLDAIKKLTDHKLSIDDTIRFEGFPKFEIVIQGESFDGGVPTRIMPALIELQRSINRTYAEYIHNDRKQTLSKEERKTTEFIVRLKKGSSIYEAVLESILNRMVANMTSGDMLIAILGIAAIYGVTSFAKHRWSIKLDERKMDHELRMNEEETNRIEKIISLINNRPALKRTLSDVQHVDELVAKGLTNEDVIKLYDGSALSGEQAKQASRKPRSEPVESRLDGKFHIEAVDTVSIPDGFKLRVRKKGAHNSMSVDIPAGTLNEEQTKILQSSEWGKKPTNMQINVRSVGNSIKKATLIQAGLTK